MARFVLLISPVLESRDYNLCQDGDEEDPGGPGGGGCVAPVLLTETHDTVLPALRHADVVHHEEVDVDLVRAGPPD